MARMLKPDGSAAEARRWAGGRVSQKKDKLPAKQRPDGMVAGNWLQEACSWDLLAEDRSLPHRAVPELDGESAYRLVLVVPRTGRRHGSISSRYALS